MEYIGYYNGKIGPLSEMTVPMNDRAVYFGDGCYDATYCVDKTPYAIDDHIERFFNSCRLLEISFHLTRDELKTELQKCMDAAGDGMGFLYWQCSRGTDIRHQSFPAPDIKPNLIITVVPKDMITPDVEMKLTHTEDTRFLHCNIKTINLIPSVIANQRAAERGCHECVFHRGDVVTECSHSNVHILKNGVVRTHPSNHLILPGIARQHMLEQARLLGIPVDETAFTMDELRNADEVIVTSSGTPCGRALWLDGEPIGGKDEQTVKKLQESCWDRFRDGTKK